MGEDMTVNEEKENAQAIIKVAQLLEQTTDKQLQTLHETISIVHALVARASLESCRGILVEIILELERQTTK